MSDRRYPKRQAVAARNKQHIDEESRKLRELVASLPFHRIILNGMRERQQREVRSKRHRNDKSKN